MYLQSKGKKQNHWLASVVKRMQFFGLSYKFRTLFIVFSVLGFSSSADAQGVRDRCPNGDCYGGGDFGWVYILLFAYLILYIIVGLFSKDTTTRSSAINVLKISLRTCGYFVGLPVFIYHVTGGYGQGGEHAVAAFFILLLFAIFYSPVIYWMLGEKEE